MEMNERYGPIARVAGEFIGSAFLVLAAIGPIVLFDQVLDSGLAVAVLADALAVAFVLFALIDIIGPVSGAHFNPAVTLAFLIKGDIDLREALSFIPAQVLGGLTGMMATHLMFYKEIGILAEVSQIPRGGGAFLAEFLGTFILVFGILMLVQIGSDRTSLVVGLLVGGMLMATSSTMFANPQVTIARMFTYSAAGIAPIDGIVFIIVEMTASIGAVILWRTLFRTKIDNEQEEIKWRRKGSFSYAPITRQGPRWRKPY